MKIPVIITGAILLCLVLSMQANAVSPGGLVLSGSILYDRGYAYGWEPMFYFARSTESDLNEWLYTIPVCSNGTFVGGGQVELGVRNTISGMIPFHSYEGYETTFVGTQVYAFDFSFRSINDFPWSGSTGLSLQLWGGDTYANRQLRWVSNGPWSNEIQHIYLQVPGWWQYEYRLAIEGLKPVPEPEPLLVIAFMLSGFFVIVIKQKCLKEILSA